MTESTGEIGTGFSVDVATSWERALFADDLPATRRVALRSAIVLGHGGVLGPLRGLASLALYVLLGAVGLPFYSDASSGWEVVTGATGGYLIGFLPAAFLIGLAARYGQDRQVWRALPLFVAGQAVVFAIGVPWLAVAATVALLVRAGFGLSPYRIGRRPAGIGAQEIVFGLVAVAAAAVGYVRM